MSAALKVPKNIVASIILKWKAPKDSQTTRNQIIWSDETKIELFGLNAKCHVWRKSGTITTVKHGFSAAVTGRPVRIEGKMN